MGNKPKTLTNIRRIQVLFRTGRRQKNNFLTLVLKKNHTEENRFLFCSEKSVRGAVDRNRIKRIQREIVRLETPNGLLGYDIALIAGTGFEKMKHLDRIALYRDLIGKYVK